METTPVRSLKTRGDGLSGACLGMVRGHGYRRGIYGGYLRDYPRQFPDKFSSARGYLVGDTCPILIFGSLVIDLASAKPFLVQANMVYHVEAVSAYVML